MNVRSRAYSVEKLLTVCRPSIDPELMIRMLIRVGRVSVAKHSGTPFTRSALRVPQRLVLEGADEPECLINLCTPRFSELLVLWRSSRRKPNAIALRDACMIGALDIFRTGVKRDGKDGVPGAADVCEAQASALLVGLGTRILIHLNRWRALLPNHREEPRNNTPADKPANRGNRPINAAHRFSPSKFRSCSLITRNSLLSSDRKRFALESASRSWS